MWLGTESPWRVCVKAMCSFDSWTCLQLKVQSFGLDSRTVPMDYISLGHWLENRFVMVWDHNNLWMSLQNKFQRCHKTSGGTVWLNKKAFVSLLKLKDSSVCCYYFKFWGPLISRGRFWSRDSFSFNGVLEDMSKGRTNHFLGKIWIPIHKFIPIWYEVAQLTTGSLLAEQQQDVKFFRNLTPFLSQRK